MNKWIRPLHCHVRSNVLTLLAPNRYVLSHVRSNLLETIEDTVMRVNENISEVSIAIGSYDIGGDKPLKKKGKRGKVSPVSLTFNTGLLDYYTFENHVEGKSNQIARAAAFQISQNPGNAYNPLFIYGGVGLGKTHLMQATGNEIRKHFADATVMFITAERFVNHMVTALKSNSMNDFQKFYRSLDALLIDDIQFFAGKTQTQEEFFHTFNALLDGQRQIIITSDRIPRAINDVHERLKSRFDSGLTVSIDPPELETRVAILERKALEKGHTLSNDVSFFIANVNQSDIRDMQGYLNKLIAYSGFTGRTIDVDLVREALRDDLIDRQRRLSIENIQQTVAQYFNIRISDLLSKNRKSEITWPRQLAMSFAKELTTLSLPQIGDKFGGRDHTTVIHSAKRVAELIGKDAKREEDYRNLERLFRG